MGPVIDGLILSTFAYSDTLQQLAGFREPAQAYHTKVLTLFQQGIHFDKSPLPMMLKCALFLGY